MISFVSRLTTLGRAVFVCAALAVSARAAEPPIIAKARAYIGPEAALNAITSVRFVSTLVTADPSDSTKQTRATMEIIFQKPDQQRITATSGQTVEVTALDGYEAWQRIDDISDRSKWKQNILPPEQVKRLRANTWENLAFFRGIEQVGGRLEDQGTTTVDGVACQKLAFIHNPKVIFFRYFEIATGRLVLTETEAGGTIRERGETRVQGVRFPRSILSTTKNAKGELQDVTIEFESIYLNEKYPASYFAMPLPMGR